MGDAKRLRDKACKMKAGMMGLAEGHQPHVLDAIELEHEVWDAMNQDGIAMCDLA